VPVRHETLGYYVGLLTRLMAQAMKVRNGEDGVLPGQFPIALALLDGRSLTQKELCEVVRIEQGTMAATLKRMERNGLVSRTPDTADQRQFLFALTPRGVDLTQRAIVNTHAVNAVAAEGLSEQDRHTLRRSIGTMIANLERDLAAQRGGSTPSSKD